MVQTGLQTQIAFSRHLTNKAIKQAVDHADEVYGDWSERAYTFLKAYTQTTKVFMAEDVREAAKGTIPEAPTARAWGAIIRRAVTEGCIERLRYQSVRNLKAHRTLASVWRVVGSNETEYEQK